MCSPTVSPVEKSLGAVFLGIPIDDQTRLQQHQLASAGLLLLAGISSMLVAVVWLKSSSRPVVPPAPMYAHASDLNTRQTHMHTGTRCVVGGPQWPLETTHHQQPEMVLTPSSCTQPLYFASSKALLMPYTLQFQSLWRLPPSQLTQTGAGLVLAVGLWVQD